MQRIRWAVFGALRVRRRFGPKPTAESLRTAAAVVEAEAERNRVRRAVGALPPEQRVVVERHDYGGETFEEIADAEKVHRSTVFSRYSRALESLRRVLAPSEGD